MFQLKTNNSSAPYPISGNQKNITEGGKTSENETKIKRGRGLQVLHSCTLPRRLGTSLEPEIGMHY